MKFFTKNSVLQKMIIAVLIVILVCFTIPQRVYGADVLSTLLENIILLVDQLGDVAMGLLNNTMLGTDGIGSAMLEKTDPNFTNSSSWLYKEYNASGNYDVVFTAADNINPQGFFKGEVQIPNMLYSPENIFANNIAALDINFLKPNKYEAVTVSDKAQDKAVSSIDKKDAKDANSKSLREIVASWYKSFRNIAVVGLLSVLIYIGIRILISSTAEDKAKYKENLKDWFMALCLVFVIHLIMSGVLMMTDKFTELFAAEINKGISVKDEVNQIAFNTNLMGLVRYRAQSSDLQAVVAYSVIYFALVIYTFMFTFIYYKRFLYMAFFTMIAPLVALTYPLDKIGDGKSQAFNMWFKEYTMNAIIQPVHLILYTVFVSSAIDLATDNPIYALVAIGFLIPAEKFIKRMFKLDKADSPGGLGSFAGGALAMKGLETLANKAKGSSSKSGKTIGESSSEDSKSKDRIKMNDRQTLGNFNDEDNNDDNEENENGPRLNENMDDNEALNQDDMTADNFENEQEKARLKEELDQYDDNDIYMNPELAEKQARYQELENQEAEGQEEIPNQDFDNEIYNDPDELEPDKGWRKRRALRGAKAIGSGLYKGVRATAGLAIGTTATVGGAMIGLGAGLTTGDPSKAFSYATAGSVAGKTLGTAAGKGLYKATDYKNMKNKVKNIDDMVFDARQKYNYNKNEDKYGAAVAKQMAMEANNQRAKKQFIKDRSEQDKYKEMASRIYTDTGKKYEAKDLMNAAFDYKTSGIVDEKQIERGLTLEAKHGGVNGNNHEKMIDVMDFAQTYKKDSITDEKKRTAVEGVVQSSVKGVKNQKEVMNLLAEAHGLGDYYKKVGKIGNKPAQPKTTNNKK